MADAAKLNIPITASNDTEKGAKEAEKRLGAIGKRVSDANRKAMNDNQRSMLASTRTMVSSFGKVEQAAARVFGGGSMTSGLAGKLGAVSQAASAMGNGLAGAAASTSSLSQAVGATATVLGGTVAVLGAAAAAAYKFATDWANGASQIGRTADIIGVSTKALQEFTAASERAGVSRGTASSALGSLSATLNDARYGKNVGASEVLRRLGVGMQLNKDGTVNTEAMLPGIANAIAKLNSAGRRDAATALGIPLDALPAFSQGGKALAADMADSDRTANVLSDGQIATARRVARKGVMIGQIGERIWNKKLMGSLATNGEGAIDGALQAARAMNAAIDGDFKPGASLIHRAADTMATAVDKFAGSIVGNIEGSSVSLSGSNRDKASQVRSFFMSKGWSAQQAAGIAANLMTESGFNPSARGDSGLAYGVAQWHPDRQAAFRGRFGHDIRHSTLGEQLEFVDWELRNTRRGAGQKLRGASSASDAGSIVSRYYEGPKLVEYEATKRAAIAAGIDNIPIKVTVSVDQHGKVTGAKAVAGSGRGAAISHAIPR